MMHYILNENKEIIEVDLMTWARFFEDIEKRRVAYHELDDVRISTIFLGIDHSFSLGPNTTPVLFETLCFVDDEMERYCTYDEALAGHYRHCERVWGKDWRNKFDTPPTEDT